MCLLCHFKTIDICDELFKKGSLLVYFEKKKNKNGIPDCSVRYTALEQVTCWCLGFGKQTQKSGAFSMIAGSSQEREASLMDL